MQPTSTISLLPYFSPLRWAGPIFDKELRVASRRRRNYALRFVYVGLLAFFMVWVWLFVVRFPSGSTAVLRASRLGEAGKQIVVTILWFQFVTAQVLAAILLSDAIGGEIRQRTLDALLVTPVGSFQIVMGKLLSKLLQLVALLAVSLPLLAIVRAFGGVPWDYVLSGLGITLAAAIFAASLSMFCSVAVRQAPQAFLVVGLWYLVVWGILTGLLVSLGATGYIGNATVQSILLWTHPVLVMLHRTQQMLAGGGGARVFPAWPLHCLLLLASAGLLLLLSAWRVRRVALAAILAGADGGLRSARARRKDARASVRAKELARRAIRPVRGSPIVWKELCAPLLGRRRRDLIYAAVLVAVVIAAVVMLSLMGGPVYALFFLLIQVFQFLFVLRLAVCAAGTVTREKEARTWPILLTTPLDNREIARGKAIGVLYRNLLLLAPLPVLYVLAYLCGPMAASGLARTSFSALVQIAGLAGAIVFLLGVGLYLSTRLKTTTAAVMATLGVYLLPKFFCCGPFGSVFLMSWRGFTVAAQAHAGGLLIALAAFVVPAVVYAVVGLLCIGAATRRLRYNVF